MDHQEGVAPNIPPLFIRNNYASWSVRMRCHLMSLGCKIQTLVEKGYKIPNNLPTNRDELDECESNAKALNEILKGLVDSVFVKFMQCKTTKHAWEKLKIAYEGHPKVKKLKPQTYKGEFKSLKMKEEENIAEYVLRVDEVFNYVRGLGGEIDEK